MNCEKVFSEVASEKLLDEMVKMIENPQADHSNKTKAMNLIKAWGESEELAYLPVFHQTYMVSTSLSFMFARCSKNILNFFLSNYIYLIH